MKKMKIKTPIISKALVDYLDKLLPPKDYDPLDSMNEIQHYSGKRAMVNLLRHLHQEQKGK